VNRKLTDQQIVSTLEALSATGMPVSGRALRAALRAQFGAVGKTERVFALCRSRRGSDEPASACELHARLEEAEQGRAAAEVAREQALQRVERSEAREMAHQDRWANEIYALRQTVQQLQGESSVAARSKIRCCDCNVSCRGCAIGSGRTRSLPGIKMHQGSTRAQSAPSAREGLRAR
jgi:hypothetical protein